MRSNMIHRPECANYLANLLSHLDSEFLKLLDETRQHSDTLGKTQISLSANEASILSLLIQLHQPQKVIEIGTLTGYSALWILRALQLNGGHGEFWTIEKDAQHAAMAKSTLQKMQTSVKIQILNQDAKEALPALRNQGPFDCIFIDGNKSAYCDYLDWAEQNLVAGGLIVADNVFAGGGVYGQTDGRFSEKMIETLKRFNLRLAEQNKFTSSLLPTSEGLFIAIKK